MSILSNSALERSRDGARRIPSLDVARGVAVLAMAAYHLAWDLSELRLIATEVTAHPGWQAFARAIAGSFLFLAGVGLVLAHRGRIHPGRFLRRLLAVAGAALLITIATRIVFPESYIFFGILHAIAVSSVIALPFTQAPAWAAASAAALVTAATMLRGAPVLELPALAFLGLASTEPVTNDWVPLVPWSAFALAGVSAAKAGARWLYRPPPPASPSRAGRALAWAGRHSLAIYLLHQPILFGALWTLVQITGPNLAAVAARVERGCPASYVAGGVPDATARAICLCSIDEMKRIGMWEPFLRGGLSPEDQGRIGEAARGCFGRLR